MTSNLGCKPVDWTKYGMIYCASQKNMGAAGCCVNIIRRDLLGKAHKYCPSIYNY